MAVVVAERTRDADAAVASVAVAVDTENVGECPPFGTNMTQEEVDLRRLEVVVVVDFALLALLATFDFPERCLVHLAHSFRDHDRWFQGYDLVEAAEILTWAERGMPLLEHGRTPLWSNSDQERTSPGLIFLAVRRARYTNCRDEKLRIAWTWRGNFGPSNMIQASREDPVPS
jgi:hypothetical protein